MAANARSSGRPPQAGDRDKLADENATLLLHRVRSEFLEMPGLRLTPVQAARLWALDRATVERILDGLTQAGFLWRNPDGAYLRPSKG